MLKEEKIATLTTKQQRLQLIRIFVETEDESCKSEYWQVRLNRKRIKNEFYYPAAIKYFNQKVYSITNETEINFIPTELEIIQNCDIRITKPEINCIYCNIRNFKNSENKYAMCKNPKKCKGLTEIDIKSKPNHILMETSCKNCKDKKIASVGDTGEPIQGTYKGTQN